MSDITSCLPLVLAIALVASDRRLESSHWYTERPASSVLAETSSAGIRSLPHDAACSVSPCRSHTTAPQNHQRTVALHLVSHQRQEYLPLQSVESVRQSTESSRW